MALRWIARTADGWIPLESPEEGTREQLAKLHEYAEAEGREVDEIGLHGHIRWPDRFDPEVLIERVESWEELGADYLFVGTIRQGYDPDEHVQAIERFADVIADAGISLSK